MLSIVLITLVSGFTGVNSAGYPVNMLDITPRFTGILMGISNSFATVAGLTSPLVTGWLTNDMVSSIFTPSFKKVVHTILDFARKGDRCDG